LKRASIINFISVLSNEILTIKSALTKENIQTSFNKNLPVINHNKPFQSLNFLKSNIFTIHIILKDTNHSLLFEKCYESDNFGNFHISISTKDFSEEVNFIEVYETSIAPGIELHLGVFFPMKISNPKNIIISDFDKTLVDTKYSTTKEVFNSLTQPLNFFPTVKQSLDLFNKYRDNGFHPFILSASPLFYERPIRDWLYQNKIYNASIFLKDLRRMFSIDLGDLTTKDIKLQGIYKLNHLIDIICMTGIPDKLILIGDNFESDPIIYATLAKILNQNPGPWAIWNKIHDMKYYQLTTKQNTLLLEKLYYLNSILQEKGKSHNVEIEIFIRTNNKEDIIRLPDFFAPCKKIIQPYYAS
jgi:phosphatidate phosphatase APP1